jgi:Zn-dependent protease
MEEIIQQIAVYAIPVLFAITVHEAAHGYVARMFGDNTAYVLGRVTLNPVKHIDPLGTIVIPSCSAGPSRSPSTGAACGDPSAT